MLGDANGRRFAYYDNEPLPTLVALFFDINKGLEATPFQKWSDVEAKAKMSGIFHCPSADRSAVWEKYETHGVSTLNLVTDWLSVPSAWKTTFDYAVNGVVTGYNADPTFSFYYHNGNVGKARKSSSITVLSGDGMEEMVWTYLKNGVSGNRITLADANIVIIKNGEEQSKSFDTRRHRGRVNLLFLDGHVANATVKPGTAEKPGNWKELEQCMLYKAK